MLVLLASIFVVHTATLIMLFVSTISNVWVVSDSIQSSVGLWKNCSNSNCDVGLSYGNEGIYQNISPLPAVGVVSLWGWPDTLILPALLPTDALKAVQAFMILSIIFSVISLVVFLFQLFTMEKGNRFFLSGATMLVCWLCILIGVSIYTHHYANRDDNFVNNGHHGYCFILTWICFCFSLIIGVLYLVLRKK
uniref:Epithelial membrane protein 1 n=1 Tax=Castor canadensis TaxID=51338 RepID=A0A8C0VYM8_CASCN